MVIAVYKSNTKEILALLVEDGQCVVRDGVDFSIYESTEPMLKEYNGKIYLDESKFILQT